MIDQADARLQTWVGTVVGDIQVSLAPPSDETSGEGVSVYLVELVAAPPMRGERRTPLQLALRYLVTTWADDPAAAHRLLGELVLGAMQSEDFEVELSPVPAETWSALGVAPRPSFWLRVPVRRQRPEALAKLVRKPLVLRGGPMTQLRGVVLGPGDVPVAGARVEVPTADAATETDWQGRFHLSGVPAEPARKLVRVVARGRQQEVEIVEPKEDQPVVIRFELED